MRSSVSSPHRKRLVARAALAGVLSFFMALPSPASASAGNATDPDDVDLPLDLQALTHTNDESSITFTATTYQEFPDQVLDFKWGIDKNADDAFDVIVFAEWQGDQLIGGVDDIEEREPIAEGQVSRPAPNAVAITFPVSALGSVTSYRYQVSSENDANANGEDDPGEQDFAPNEGFYNHDLAK